MFNATRQCNDLVMWLGVRACVHCVRVDTLNASIARNAIATYTKIFFFFWAWMIFFFQPHTCSQWGPMVVTHTLSFSFLFQKMYSTSTHSALWPWKVKKYPLQKTKPCSWKSSNHSAKRPRAGRQKIQQVRIYGPYKRLSSPTHLHFLLPFSLESVDRSWKGTIDWFPGG